jgi:hypothetical protein
MEINPDNNGEHENGQIPIIPNIPANKRWQGVASRVPSQPIIKTFEHSGTRPPKDQLEVNGDFIPNRNSKWTLNKKV